MRLPVLPGGNGRALATPPPPTCVLRATDPPIVVPCEGRPAMPLWLGGKVRILRSAYVQRLHR